MKKFCWLTLFAVAATAPLESNVEAAREATHLGVGEDGALIAERGAALRKNVRVQWNQAPAAARTRWSRFVAAHPGRWRALWDADLGVALRVYGRGVDAPGTSSSPAAAERFALAFASDNADLLAPGLVIGDFTVVSNVLDRSGVRSVGLVQRRCGLVVVGGQLSFRFKNDRLFVIASEVFPDVPCMRSSSPIDLQATNAAARALLAARYGDSAAAIGDPTAPQILPLVRQSGAVDYKLARRARVDSLDPIGSWDVWVDAVTGEPLARRQRLAFASATLRYRVGDRYWAGTRSPHDAHQTTITVNGNSMTTGADATFAWGAGAASLTAFARGPRVRVTSEAGAAATLSVSASAGDVVVWDGEQSEFLDAQLTTYIHALVVKEWLRVIDPDHPFYAAQLPAIVNKSGSCNAFSDGTSINFLRAGNGCGNTGRIADVIYHEFGHSMHNHSLIPGVGSWDGALSEGLGDFLSATITGDPAVGPGFFGDGSVLRHCDPAGGEQVWPDDIGEIHHTGKIYCGTMFDLRKNLISVHGESEGVAVTNRLFYESFRRASNIPTTYVEVLAADDDDGNLENGTPNECAINEAYGRHGMGNPDGPSTPPLGTPTLDGLRVSLRAPSSPLCPGGGVQSASLEWALQKDPTVNGAVDFEPSGELLVANIPRAPWGSVVRYQVRVTMSGGEQRTFPENPADDAYQMFVGEGEVIACDSFDGPSQPTGWEHGLLSGDDVEGADDWQWGPVFGAPGSGDPRSAFSGDNVWGNDLGAGNFNGTYQAEKTNYLSSPVFDGSGYDVVRLQYRRWLNVEDGAYDVASIEVASDDGDFTLWTNKDDAGASNHTDREWRFHDVELTSALGGGPGRVTFKLASDQGTELGGWTIDDFCIIGYDLPVCGDGVVAGDEICDDGNTESGDGCDAVCTPEEDPEDPTDPEDPSAESDGGCGCQSGGPGDCTLGVLLFVGLLAFRRRRRS